MNEYDADIYLHFKLFSNNNLIFYSPSPPVQGETEKGAAARRGPRKPGVGRAAGGGRDARSGRASVWLGRHRKEPKEGRKKKKTR